MVASPGGLIFQAQARAAAREDEHTGGICGSNKLAEDRGQGYGHDMLVYPYNEGGEFWTGPEFGCVHHEMVQLGGADAD